MINNEYGHGERLSPSFDSFVRTFASYVANEVVGHLERVKPGQPEGPRLMLTVEQPARRLSVGRTYIYQLINSGELGSIRIGALRRIPVSALDEFVDYLRARSER